MHKKGTKTECSNFRTITLIFHANNVMQNILHKRIKTFLLPEIALEQTGFVPERDRSLRKLENIINWYTSDS